MNLAKTESTSLNKLKQRVVKFLRLGNRAETAIAAAPYGIDANPIKNMVAVYAKTAIKGQDVIVGYLNKDLKADTGELRLYSTDANGTEKAWAWLKSDGTIHLLGDADNLVRYTPLNSNLQNLVGQVQAELVKIQTAITAVGGTYTPGTLNLDINDAKITELKTTA